MIRSIIWTVIFCIAAIIVQSTLIGMIPFAKVKPDLALVILVFSAYVNGTMTGQVSGFFSGLFQDFLSASPPGMNCLMRTLIGALTGIFKGAFFLDFFLMPLILCIIATFLKAFILFILHLIMGQVIPAISFTTSPFWIELGLNAFCGPLLFFLLKRFKPMLIERR
ncbi:MAG: rod shape-determining protein MreD [Treponema sp.]|nr:rod shape-determining protein MreD [Treponema sp.]MCL2251510.1 rod shape-determining protein MreD [Treponema sp.]